MPGSRAGIGVELRKSYAIVLSSVGSLLHHTHLQVITCTLEICHRIETFCFVLLHMSACCTESTYSRRHKNPQGEAEVIYSCATWQGW